MSANRAEKIGVPDEAVIRVRAEDRWVIMHVKGREHDAELIMTKDIAIKLRSDLLRAIDAMESTP
ncbi:unnamed protein product [uncultured bacterium]|nr:unnamed protein product [uncultured bacterium]